MLLTRKLLSFLNRVFDKDPRAFLALRLSYNGQMTWAVADAVLTTSVTGGTGRSLSIDLTQYTLASLVQFLVAQPGYSVPFWDQSENAALGARVLLDGAGDQSLSNGDHLFAYTSVLWSWLEPAARELQTAADQIEQALAQMNTRTAGDMWLDEWGGYYGVPREAGELDASYGPRIIAEVLRPRSNNVAIEAAVKAYTGQQVSVTDVTVYAPTAPVHDASISYDGTHHYDAASAPVYGLFDVLVGYDLLNAADFTATAATLRALVGRLRAAGTHLRSLVLTGSAIADSQVPATDGPASIAAAVAALLSDAQDAASEAMSSAIKVASIDDVALVSFDDAVLVIEHNFTYSGLRLHDGSFTHSGVGPVTETLSSDVALIDGSSALDGSHPLDGNH